MLTDEQMREILYAWAWVGEPSDQVMGALQAAAKLGAVIERERCARACEKRAENRMHEHGDYDPSTNAWEYPRHYGDLGNRLDEEDDDCAAAIRSMKQ